MAVIKPPFSILAVLLLPCLCLGVDMDLWTTYCPLTKFCTMDNSTFLEETKETGLEDTIAMADCCTGCSCEPDCWMTSNCCPDVKHVKTVNSKMASCMKLFVRSEFDDIDMYDGNDVPEYRIINFCPRHFNDSDVIDICEERFVAITNLNDVVAIIDDKNRIFKNRFCALCHGAQNTISWDLHLLYCEEAIDEHMEGIRGSEFHSTILEKCVLLSVPPEDLPLSASTGMMCGNSTISSCPDVNVTSGVDEVTRACHLGPYLPYTNGSTDVYKNVFCYLCQTNVTEEVVNVCQFASTEAEVNDTQWSRFRRIGQRLDLFLGDKLNQGNASLSKCKETEFFDPIMETCTRMYCPEHSVMSYGRCIDIGYNIGSVQIQLILYPVSEIYHSGPTTVSYDWKTKRPYTEDFLVEFGFEACGMDAFLMNILFEHGTDKLTAVRVVLYLVSNGNCSIDYITQTARDEFSQFRSMPVPINETDFVGKINFYNVTSKPTYGAFSAIYNYDYTKYYATRLVTWYRNFYTPAHFENTFFFCPYMIIGIVQYNTIMAEVYTGDGNRNLTEITEQTRVHDGFYTLTENSIIVCVDTYIQLYSALWYKQYTSLPTTLPADEYRYGNAGKTYTQFSYLALLANALILLVW